MKNLRAIYNKIFGKGEWIENPKLKQAIQKFKNNPTALTRKKLYEVFLESFLWIAIKDLPEGMPASTSPTIVTLEMDYQMRISTNANGDPVMAVFTDLTELQNRNKSNLGTESQGAYAQSASQIIKVVVKDNFAGIVINPAGNWVELSRAEIDEISNLTA